MLPIFVDSNGFETAKSKLPTWKIMVDGILESNGTFQTLELYEVQYSFFASLLVRPNIFPPICWCGLLKSTILKSLYLAHALIWSMVLWIDLWPCPDLYISMHIASLSLVVPGGLLRTNIPTHGDCFSPAWVPLLGVVRVAPTGGLVLRLLRLRTS